MSLRVGVVGARRSRQGIGEHVARHLAALGAEVAAIVGTRPETAEEARCQLQQRYRIDVRAYTALDAMLAAAGLDAVAICSPQECHRQHLQQALAAGVHVLCEKPLVFNPGCDPAADARPLVEGFAAAGKVLMVNEQWPYTLPAFEQLHPDSDARKRVPHTLMFALSPDTVGPEMIPNSLPHVLSMLFALAPSAGEAKDILVVPLIDVEGDCTAASVLFEYRHTRGATIVSAMLVRMQQMPRLAGYQIDDYAARRHIEMPEYRMYLEAAQPGTGLPHIGKSPKAATPRRVPMQDPLQMLLADFLNRCEQASRGNELKQDTTILERLVILRDVYAAACDGLRHAIPGARVQGSGKRR